MHVITLKAEQTTTKLEEFLSLTNKSASAHQMHRQRFFGGYCCSVFFKEEEKCVCYAVFSQYLKQIQTSSLESKC